MKRILFVDDEPNVLQGLQRMLRSLRHEWEMVFAASGQEALERLECGRFDVVVSDMRMPYMNGAQLLAEVRLRQPQAVRIILSGQSDQEALLRSIGAAHQYLSKPCDAETLKAILARAGNLREFMASETLQRLVSQMEALPGLPCLYLEMVEASQAPNVSAQEVGQIIARDIGMTAKLLQMVNSAFFGLSGHVCSPTEAAGLIGLDTTKALVLSVQAFAQFRPVTGREFSQDALWRHSLAVARYARQIARVHSGDRRIMDDAFTAGLLHDAGKLALATSLPERYDETLALARRQRIPLVDAERSLLGATHAEVGAYLMALWGLPDPIVETLAFHHCPQRREGRDFSPLAAVHAADALDHETHGEAGAGVGSTMDHDYLESLGLGEHIPTWRQMCRRVAEEEEI